MTEMFVIAVSEQRQAALAGCAAQSYTSPPQSWIRRGRWRGSGSARQWRAPARGGTRSPAVSARSR